MLEQKLEEVLLQKDMLKKEWRRSLQSFEMNEEA